MSRSSNKNRLSIFVPLIAGAFVAKALWVFVDYKYLPKEGVEKELKSSVKPLYYRYSLASKKDAPKPIIKKKSKIKVPTKKRAKAKPLEIKKFTLKGIIYENEEKGLATIEYKDKSYVLARGEELEGFKLYKFAPKYTIFIKDAKEYKLDLYSKKKLKSSKKRDKKKKHSRIMAKKSNNKEQKQEQEEKGIIQDGETTIISKNLFDKYKKDMDAIKKSIGVAPVMEDDKLKGFKVRYIKKGSDFDKLGIKKDDIITAINGEEITDLSVPLEFFNNLETISNATITIKRGNEEKELEYEVR